MKNKKRLFSYIFTAVYISFLVACGGGGSGESDDDQSPVESEQSPSYNGNIELAKVNRQSALQLAQLVVSSANLVLIVDSLWVEVPSGTADQKKAVKGSEGGSAEFTLSGNKMITKFKGYTENGITLNGSIEQTIDTSEKEWRADSYPSNIAGTLKFDRLKLSGQGLEFLLHGSVEGRDYAKLTFNLLMQDIASGQSAKLENFVIGWDRLPSLVSFYPDLEVGYMSGTLYDSELGKIEIATSKPFHELGFDEDGLLYGIGNGIVDIAGDGLGLQLVVMNKRYAALTLDEDGDGGHETGMRVSWNQVLGLEPLVAETAVRLPVANTGPDLDSMINVPTFVNGLFSHGAEGRFLTYHWQVSDLPVFGNSELPYSGDSAHFEFNPGRTGDYLLTLTVSDGELSSRSTQKIQVWEDGGALGLRYSPAQAIYGELEVSSSADKREYTFDSRSAMESYDDELGISVSGENKDRYIMDQNSGHPVRILYNPDDVSGILRVYTGRVATLVNIGFGRYESHSYTSVGKDNVQALVTAEFGSGNGADILNHYKALPKASDFYGEDRFYLEVLWTDDTTVTTRLLDLLDSVPAGNAHLTLGDLNGDGWQDAVTMGEKYIVPEGEEGVYVSLQVESYREGKNKLSEPQVYLFPANVDRCDLSRELMAVSVADFDADKKMDVLAFADCDYLPPKLIVWRGLGDGRLEEPLLYEFELSYIDGVDFSDFNGDGRTDISLIICSQSCSSTNNSSSLAVYINQLDGFIGMSILEDPETAFSQVVAGDFNDDGKPDLLYADQYGDIPPKGTLLLTQQNDGSFVQTTVFPDSWPSRNRFLATDLTGNGHTDFIFPRADFLLQLALNNGEGSYSKIGLEYGDLEVNWTGRVSVADRDGDGGLDIVLQSWYGFHTLFSGIHPYVVPVAAP